MRTPTPAPATDRRALAHERLIQAVAPVLALAILLVALSIRNSSWWPGAARWPQTIAAVILGVGLGAAPLAHRLRGSALREAVQTAAAVAALLILLAGLVTLDELTPRWPFAAAGVVLAFGLAAAPLARAGGRRLPLATVPALVCLVALGVLIIAMSSDVPSSSYTRWPLWIPAAVLITGFALGPPVRRLAGAGVQLVAQTVVAVVALAIIVDGLSSASELAPRWPLVMTAVLLALAVGTGWLAQLAGGPREQVLNARVDELSRTRRGALDVQATELRRIERDLHDGAQARLVALSMKLGRAEDRFGEDPEIGALLREAREDAAAAIRELRELARGIAPPVLSDRGLEAAVRSLAQRTGAKVAVSGTLAPRPQPAVETAAYFVVAESLTNAAKHAAGARVEVRIDERGGDLFVEVTDFGPGEADPDGGGLTGLRQRVEALDGALHVTSPAGVGTQVEAVLPCGR